MKLALIIPFAFALIPSILAHPASVEQPRDIDFHIFPEFSDLEQLDQLAYNDSSDDEEVQAIEARAANACTLAKLKENMFDCSKPVCPLTPSQFRSKYSLTDPVPRAITQFESARNAKSPSCFDWRSNKCTLSPDRPLGFNFIPPCHRHDFGNTNFEAKKQWNPVNKARTDWRFRTDMLDVCATYTGWKNLAKRALCTVVANDYANAVVLFNPSTDL